MFFCLFYPPLSPLRRHPWCPSPFVVVACLCVFSLLCLPQKIVFSNPACQHFSLFLCLIKLDKTAQPVLSLLLLFSISLKSRVKLAPISVVDFFSFFFRQLAPHQTPPAILFHTNPLPQLCSLPQFFLPSYFFLQIWTFCCCFIRHRHRHRHRHLHRLCSVFVGWCYAWAKHLSFEHPRYMSISHQPSHFPSRIRPSLYSPANFRLRAGLTTNRSIQVYKAVSLFWFLPFQSYNLLLCFAVRPKAPTSSPDSLSVHVCFDFLPLHQPVLTVCLHVHFYRQVIYV